MQFSLHWGMSAKSKGTSVRGSIYSHYPRPKRLSTGWLLPGLNNWDENNQARAKHEEVGFVLVRAYNRKMITKNVGPKKDSVKRKTGIQNWLFTLLVCKYNSRHTFLTTREMPKSCLHFLPFLLDWCTIWGYIHYIQLSFHALNNVKISTKKMVSPAGENILASAHGGFPCNRTSQNINHVRRRRKQS